MRATFGVPALPVLAWLSWATAAQAQDLEPRAYSSSPTGTNFVLLGYGLSTGDVLFTESRLQRNATTRIGSDFKTLATAWQWLWMD